MHAAGRTAGEVMRPRSTADPTSNPALARSLRETLADPVAKRYIDHLKARRIALVLSGGGGKGSYEAGVILALFDCGIRKFCAIAGTSVGALNAVLCHEVCRTGDRNLIVKLWAGISLGQVARTNPLRLIAVAVVALLRLLAFIPQYLILRTHLLFGKLMPPPPGISVAPAAGSLATMWSAVVVIIAAVAFYGGVQVLGIKPSEIQAKLFLGAAIFGAMATLVFRDWIGRQLSLLSNAPLREQIMAIDLEPVRRSDVPVYCTMTAPAEWWDPFEKGPYPLVSDGARRRWAQPYYLRLGASQDAGEVGEWLLQSAAIPELFPRRQVLGEYCVGRRACRQHANPCRLGRPTRTADRGLPRSHAGQAGRAGRAVCE